MDWHEENDAIYAFILDGLTRHVEREKAIAEMLPADDEAREAAKQLDDEEIRRAVEWFIEEATRE